jgi:hypothetical protein
MEYRYGILRFFMLNTILMAKGADRRVVSVVSGD